MRRQLLAAAFLALVLGATGARAQISISPAPGPVPTSACGGGNSVLGYTAYGTALVCGTALSSGSIANGSTGQLGGYIGLNAIGPITPGGDVTYVAPNFNVGKINGVPLGSTTATAGNLLVGSGSQWVSVAPSGDIASISGSGAFLIGGGAITNAKLANSTTGINGHFVALGNAVTLTYGDFSFVPLNPANNLMEVTSALTARSNLGIGAGNAPTFAGLTLSALPSAPLLGTTSGGVLRPISLGSNLSLAGNVLDATGGGIPGITALTTDVAASGSGSVPATVTGLQGRPLTSTAPTTNQLIGWNGSSWVPVNAPVSGINQLTGDGTASGTGSVPLTLATVNSNIGTFAATTLNAKGLATGGANLTGAVTTAGAVASLSNTGVTPGSYNNANITIGADGRATAASNGSSSAVSVTSSTPDLIVSPSPGTGTFSIGSTVATNDQSAGNYTVLTGDAGKWVLIGANTVTLAQAGSTGFAAGWGTCFLNIASSGNASIGTTTSLFKGASGTTSLGLAPGDWACPASFGGNWDTPVGHYAAGGGSGVTFPANNSLVVSNTSNSPAGLAPTNGNIVYGVGGVWASTSLSGFGFLTGNQTITLTGDTTGSGATAITATTSKVNGVAYPTSPSTNTVPVVTSPNTITYEAVPNAALANSAITINGHSQALGSTLTLGFPDFSGAVTPAQLPLATSAAFGAIKGDGSTLPITAGVMACATSTTSQLGCSRPDGSSITISGGVISAPGSGGGTVGAASVGQLAQYTAATTVGGVNGITFAQAPKFMQAGGAMEGMRMFGGL